MMENKINKLLKGIKNEVTIDHISNNMERINLVTSVPCGIPLSESIKPDTSTFEGFIQNYLTLDEKIEYIKNPSSDFIIRKYILHNLHSFFNKDDIEILKKEILDSNDQILIKEIFKYL